MEFAILGPLEVHDQTRRIAVSRAKERLLLAMLVIHANEMVSVDRLVEVLWDNEPPATAENTLQTYVSHLRKALEPDRVPRAQYGLLRTRPHGYELAVPPEAIDAARFERLVHAGRDALPSAPERAAEILRAASALWRGEPLADFGFELFAQSEIARLTELRAMALEDRVEADLALGRHASLCGELNQAVVEQPLRERLWAQLIRALYRCGRQADALHAYTRLRTQLAELLGIDPSPELVRLHEAVLHQRPDLDWSPPQPQPTHGSSPPAEVPVPEKRPPTARAALAAHDWQRAFELFSAEDQIAPLVAEDLEGLAEAAWWSGRYRDGLAARQRAHHAYLQAGDHRRAGVAAVMLMMQHSSYRQFAVAEDWFQRAQRLLSAEPECAEQGYLHWGTMLVSLMRDDVEKCLAAARSTYETGVRYGIYDLQALGMVFQGGMLIHRGQVEKGVALHDEGMVMAVGGCLSQLATAQIFCHVVRSCRDLGDYRRAEEWNRAIEDCFARTGLSSFPGDCETHCVTIMIHRGAWMFAEQEAHRACSKVQCINMVQSRHGLRRHRRNPVADG